MTRNKTGKTNGERIIVHAPGLVNCIDSEGSHVESMISKLKETPMGFTYCALG
jgi:endonuclease IV